jgi:hypothetical protein
VSVIVNGVVTMHLASQDYSDTSTSIVDGNSGVTQRCLAFFKASITELAMEYLHERRSSITVIYVYIYTYIYMKRGR